jgi:hypothetical protein
MPCDISFSLNLPSLFPTPGGAISFGLSGCGPVSLATPSGPSGPSIPGFGVPFSPASLSIGLPAGMPENLLGILSYLQLLIPPGALSANLSFNFEVDIFDGIMKLLDQFMPFLMLYKFFLPVLNIIVCIIEVLCALISPFALIGALENLFVNCIPAFLNLFPMFALIIMIISILLLLLALIEYILCFIITLVLNLSGNIVGLVEAFLVSNSVGILAIAAKLGDLLCLFQDLLVLLAFFDVIIQIIKDILALGFSIPPCSGGNNSNCCNPSVCPAFIKQAPYTLSSGHLQYSSEVGTETTLVINPSTTPPTYLTIDSSSETWQLYDPDQAIYQQFINIIAAPDVIADGYNIVFFPTTQTFSASTPPAQAAYTIDITIDYNPAQWLRTGNSEKITFKNCIVLLAPTATLQGYNTTIPESTGVVYIAGGDGYDSKGKPLTGFDLIKTNVPNNQPATLGNFLHLPPSYTPTPGAPSVINLSNVTYTFTPNNSILLQNNLISLGCMPTVSLNRDFINTVVFSDVATQKANLTSLVNSPNFPSPVTAQKCLLVAITNLRANMTLEGVAEFQSVTTQCLTTLQNNTNSALTSVIGIGFSPCNSAIKVTPSTQFTTLPITVNVTLNENNGLPIANNIPTAVGAELASQIIAYPTFGAISPFVYDGYSAFNAELTSSTPGTGSIMVAFQNQIICTNVMPSSGTPSHTLQTLDYEFIYAPVNANIPETGEGDTTGIQPRRDGSGG